MGYTHYFAQKREFNGNEWNEITQKTKLIYELCAGSCIKLQYEWDTPKKPVCNRDTIRFNGAKEEGHETFMITKKHNQSFNFCKTAYKRYDLPVCLVLLVCHSVAPGALDIGSDGDWEQDWKGARDTYKMLFGEEPKCPFGVEEPTL